MGTEADRPLSAAVLHSRKVFGASSLASCSALLISGCLGNQPEPQTLIMRLRQY